MQYRPRRETPPQTVRAVPDTGSFELITSAAGCDGCSPHAEYDSSKSSTFTARGEVVETHFGQGEVVSEVPNLLPYAWVDPETGTILQPARGSAILEMDMEGNESRVLRTLPEGEWISFNARGVVAASENSGV